MQQDRDEAKGEDKREESESDSDPLDKSDSGNDERDEKEMMSPSLPSMGYSYDSNGEKGGNRLTSQKAASPLVIQWLQDNYEAADGTSLPRSTLYTHYVAFCSSMSIEPVNAASFGKLIRSIFPNLKTRRLGTRGHSKYHYYGIQIKASSELRLPAFQNESAIGLAKPKSRPKKEGYDPQEKASPPNTASYDVPITITQGASNVQLPDFTIAESISLPPEVSMEHVQTFMSTYRKHCQVLVDHVYRQQFSEVERVLRHFWQNLPPIFRAAASAPEVVEQIVKRDFTTYKAMSHVLLPNVLQALPVSIPQAIRQFSKQLEPWLTTSLEGMPPGFIMKKLAVAKRFSQNLHKQASLNHLTQAARAVLQNTNQVTQMIVDWNRLDFEFIKSQANWVCQCGDDMILSAQEDFKKFLTERASLEQWASWLQDIVARVLGKATEPREVVILSQQLLLKWSFYSTLIIRDLTIRNASSFGSFHLLRTLFDEYIFYLVDSRLNPASPLAQEPVVNFGSSHESHGPVESFSLDNLLNKDNNSRLSSKHLPYPFQDSSHDRPLPQEDDYGGRMEMLQHNENLLHMQQYPRIGNYGVFPKTVDELRMVSGFGGLNPPLKRTHEPVLKPPPSLYPYNLPDSLRSQLPAGHSLESLISTSQAHYREAEPSKKMRLEVQAENQRK